MKVNKCSLKKQLNLSGVESVVGSGKNQEGRNEKSNPQETQMYALEG